MDTIHVGIANDGDLNQHIEAEVASVAKNEHARIQGSTLDFVHVPRPVSQDDVSTWHTLEECTA